MSLYSPYVHYDLSPVIIVKKCSKTANKQTQDMSEGDDDDDGDGDEENDVGSPSPPFEGVIHEEPEKQNESQGGGEFENRNDDSKDEESEPGKEVNMKINFLSPILFSLVHVCAFY
jgi:hypothetical protein